MTTPNIEPPTDPPPSLRPTPTPPPPAVSVDLQTLADDIAGNARLLAHLMQQRGAQ